MPEFGPAIHFLATLDAKLSERETTESPVTSSEISRVILLGARVRVEGGLWERSCQERWLSAKVAADFRAGKPVPHGVFEGSMAAMERAEIVKYGAPLGVAVQSDADSKDVRSTSGIPDLPVPIPIRALYTPSLMPGWNATTPAGGKILIGEGVASFTCPFMAAPGEKPDSAVVTLASPAAPCIAAGFTYRLKLTGEFKIAFAPGTRLPRTCEGTYSVMVDGGPTGEPAARLLDHKASFEFHRVEVEETDDDLRMG